ncbi:hypothetical protein ScalyP_jg1290 [Parmales sp. scaly parma]|nr:hypothetical protein ScalyP_jg1290 [Parmales sp. scaly parma]
MDIGEFDPNYQQNMVEQNYELLVFDSRFDISEDLIDIDRRKVTWLGKKLRCAPRLSGLMISGMVAEHKGSLKRALKSLDDGWLYSLWWGAGFTNKFIFMFNVVALAAEIAFCILHSTSNNIFSPVTYLHVINTFINGSASTVMALVSMNELRNIAASGAAVNCRDCSRDQRKICGCGLRRRD